MTKDYNLMLGWKPKVIFIHDDYCIWLERAISKDPRPWLGFRWSLFNLIAYFILELEQSLRVL